MAFPGTYDIRYYKGDTYEFFIYPKNASGNTFDLSGFSEIKFTIANEVGSGSTRVAYNGEVDTDGNNTYIKCIITPDIGEQLDANEVYVYDVQIEKPAGNGVDYPYIYTILKGNISITEEVTLPAVSAPENVTSLTVTEDPAGTVVVDWVAPTTGTPATSYKIYGKSADTPIPVTSYQLITTVIAPTTVYSATSAFGVPITAIEGSTLDIKVVASNSAGDSSGVEDSVTILAAPGNVTSFNLIEDPSHADQIAGSWTAPSTGGAPTYYDIYFKATGGSYAGPLSVPASITALQTFGTVFASSVMPGVEYTVKVVARNGAGESSGTEDTITIATS